MHCSETSICTRVYINIFIFSAVILVRNGITIGNGFVTGAELGYVFA